MGRKSEIRGVQLDPAASLAANYASGPIDVSAIDNFCFSVETTGVTDNTGTFTVQHRIYKDLNHFSGWSSYTLSGTPTLADTDTTFEINLQGVPPGQIRLVFNATGGTPDGTANIWISACMVGG